MSPLDLLAEYLNLHSVLEQGERFGEVANAELVLGVLLSVLDAEVEPLLVTLCVCVHFAKQVVSLNHVPLCPSLLLKVSLAEGLGFCSVQVATLEGRVEAKKLGLESSVSPLNLRKVFCQFLRLVLRRLK